VIPRPLLADELPRWAALLTPTALRVAGQQPLPGSLTFGSDIPLPAGSVVIAHSGLLHGRRQMPGGDLESPRYFTDVCYAQHSRSGRLWESYQLKKQPGGRDDEAAEGGMPRTIIADIWTAFILGLSNDLVRRQR